MVSNDRARLGAFVVAMRSAGAGPVTAASATPSEEFPSIHVTVDQAVGYRFEVSYRGTNLRPSVRSNPAETRS